MKNLLLSATALAFTATAAQAGGLGRSDQGVNLIFEPGTVAELSYGVIRPDVDGEYAARVPGLSRTTFGNMAKNDSSWGAGFKMDLPVANLSAAVVIDEPYGASVLYPTGTGGLASIGGSSSEVSSRAVTGVVKAKLSPNASVFGGLRYQTIDASVEKRVNGLLAYSFDTDGDSSLGYVLGAAYEIPQIAARISATYHSKISHDLAISEVLAGTATTGTTDIDTPQSLQIDARTGIAPGTLVFGSVRWTDWTQTEIKTDAHDLLPFTDQSGVQTQPGNKSLLSYRDDVITWKAGIARQFSKNFTGLVSVGYEKGNGGAIFTLAPTDGQRSVTLGGQYQNGGTQVAASVTYIALGDETDNFGSFTDNSTMTAGVRVRQYFK